jgi:hypothetical protein
MGFTPSSPKRIPSNSNTGLSPHIFSRASFPPLLCPDDEPRPCEPCEETDAADDSEEAAMGECEAAKTSVWYRVPSVATETPRPAAGNASTSVLGGWSASSLHREEMRK